MAEAKGVPCVFADDGNIGARTQAEIENIGIAIGERFSSLSGGPLFFKFYKISHANSGFDFLQRRIRRDAWAGEYRVRVLPNRVVAVGIHIQLGDPFLQLSAYEAAPLIFRKTDQGRHLRRADVQHIRNDLPEFFVFTLAVKASDEPQLLAVLLQQRSLAVGVIFAELLGSSLVAPNRALAEQPPRTFDVVLNSLARHYMPPLRGKLCEDGLGRVHRDAPSGAALQLAAIAKRSGSATSCRQVM